MVKDCPIGVDGSRLECFELPKHSTGLDKAGADGLFP
jgi:hypothetical protein